MMVFNGKRETRNEMKLFTNILPGSASPLGITLPEAVDLNGINIFATRIPLLDNPYPYIITPRFKKVFQTACESELPRGAF